MRTSCWLSAVLVVVGLPVAGLATAEAQEGKTQAPRKTCPTCGAAIDVERCPTCGQGKAHHDDVDKKLDEALRKEYGDPHGKHEHHDHGQAPPPAPEQPPEPEPEKVTPPPPAPVVTDEDDEFRVRLGFMARHWFGRIFSASVAGGRYGIHGDYVRLDGGEHSAADLTGGDFTSFNTQDYRAWIDLGRYFSLEASGHYATIRDGLSLNRDFNFVGQQFFAGSRLDTKFQFIIGDFTGSLHPISEKFGRLDLIFGGRYVRSTVTFRQQNNGFVQPQPAPFPFPGNNVPVFFPIGGGNFFPPAPVPVFGNFGGGNEATQTVDGIVPLIGIGGTVRPIATKNFSLEIFARGRIGGFYYHLRDYSNHGYTDRERYYAVSWDAEGGVTIVIADTVGIMGGYRFEYNKIEREDSSSTKRAEWAAGGPFVGGIIQF